MDMSPAEFAAWLAPLPSVDGALPRYYDTPTSRGVACRLYRYFDGSGALLYIGISTDFECRDRAHWVKGGWRDRAAFVLIENYPSTRVAETAEAQAIADERPPENRKWPAMRWADLRSFHDEWWLKGRPDHRGDTPTWGILASGYPYFPPHVIPCPFLVTADGYEAHVGDPNPPLALASVGASSARVRCGHV